MTEAMLEAAITWNASATRQLQSMHVFPQDVSNITRIDASTIARDTPLDLDPQKARPKWIFSSYGPTKNCPASLMEEDEFSPEEIRLKYYLADSTGNGALADQECIQMYNKIDQDYKNVLNNIPNITKFMNEAEKKRPNRLDFTNTSIFDGTKTREEVTQQLQNGGSSGFGSGGSGGGAFGQNSFGKPPTSTFGQPQGPAAFGSKPAFGQSGFGGSGAAPTFGQGAFGKPAVSNTSSGFGQPAFGSSGFGQGASKNPFAPAAASGGFGQPSSAFGQPAQTATAFGQPSQPSGFGQPTQVSSAFGQPAQPSAFGQPSQPTSAFGQSSQPASAFGQPSQPASAFGQPAQPSAFGKPAFGQAAQPASAFGQPQQGQGLSTAFGKPAQPAANGFGSGTQSSFGQAGGFGATKQPDPDTGMESEPSPAMRPNPFGARPSTSNGFGGQPAQAQSQSPAPAPAQPVPDGSLEALNPINPLINKPAAPLHINQSLPAQPPQIQPNGRVTSYRGQPTTYIRQPDKLVDGEPVFQDPILCYKRPDTRQDEKIWHHRAGNEPTLIALSTELKKFDFQGAEQEYADEVKGEYAHLYETGQWRDGKLPLVPPQREWVAYDF